jgi:hypothetical protein
MVESATPDLNVMEWPRPCPLCWVSHLAHPNRLAGNLPNIIGKGLDHSTVCIGWVFTDHCHPAIRVSAMARLPILVYSDVFTPIHTIQVDAENPLCQIWVLWGLNSSPLLCIRTCLCIILTSLWLLATASMSSFRSSCVGGSDAVKLGINRLGLWAICPAHDSPQLSLSKACSSSHLQVHAQQLHTRMIKAQVTRDTNCTWPPSHVQISQKTLLHWFKNSWSKFVGILWKNSPMSPMYMSWSPCAWHQLIRALSHVPMHQKQGTCAFWMHSCILIPNETKIVNCAFAGVICVAFHNQVKKRTVLRCICSTLLPVGAKDDGALDFSQLMI